MIGSIGSVIRAIDTQAFYQALKYISLYCNNDSLNMNDICVIVKTSGKAGGMNRPRRA